MTTSKTTNKTVTQAAEADVMTRFAQLREILAETHAQIPQLLARQRDADRELGLNESAELRKELAHLVTERENAARRRMAAIAAIAELEGPLQAERAAVEAERQRYAVEAVNAFQERYSAIVGALQELWEEGRALGMALRCVVEMPMPTYVQTSPVDGIARAMPVRADVAVTVDDEAARLGAKVDQVDGALALVAAIKQSHDLDLRHHRLDLLRGAGGGEFGGLYRVLRVFRSQTDGLKFEVGQLIDGSLIGSGMAHRLQQGTRYIEPASLSLAA